MEDRIIKTMHQDNLSLIFMGGSVTEGYPYDERVRTPYPELVGEQMRNIFPGKKITVHNLGAIGDKVSHALLCSEAKLDKKANQLIFLEYALNDEISQTTVMLFESLIRKITGFPGKPAVIPLILPKDQNDAPQFGTYIIELCAHYHIPFLDISQYLRKKTTGQKKAWQEYTFDGIHPDQSGHRMVADFIVEYIDELCARKIEPVHFTLRRKRFLGSPFESLKLYPLPKNVTYPFAFSIKCRSLWLSYIQHEEAFMGNVQVFVDNELVQNLHGKSFYCWYYPVQIKLFENDQSSPHNITLQMAPGDEKKKFLLEYIGFIDDKPASNKF